VEVRLIDNDEATLRDALDGACRDASRLLVAVAFAKRSGLEVAPSIEQAARSGKKVELLAGLDFQLTDLDALERIAPPPSEARVYLSLEDRKVFHPKIYIAEGREQTTAIVGSSNLTSGGLLENVEANVLVRAENNHPTIARIVDFHQKLWTSSFSAPVSSELKAKYQALQDRRRRIELELRGSGDYETASRNLRAAVAEAIGGYLAPGRGSCWLLVTSPENYIRCIDGSVWGDEDPRRIQQVRAGDTIFFYVKRPAVFIAAMGVVTREPYEDHAVIWPEDDRLYPYRFNFEVLLKPARPLPFRPLISQLELFGMNEDPTWGVRLQRSMHALGAHDCRLLRGVLASAQSAEGAA